MISNAFNRQVIADNFSDLFRTANREVIGCGIESSPRGLKIKELINFTATLTNPRARLLKSEARKHSYKYAIAELLWYIRGSNNLEEIAFYAPTLRQFSDDGKSLNSAYGERIFGKHKDFPNQWTNIINKLTLDRDTRQAVININYAEDQNRQTKDVTCTLNLQFFIRDNKLHLITRMRSNDLFLGLLYDTFCFTMLQELLLLQLQDNANFKDLQLGYYMHNVGSAHLYERHFEKIKSVLNESDTHIEPMAELTSNRFDELQVVEQNFRSDAKSFYRAFQEQPWDWMVETLIS